MMKTTTFLALFLSLIFSTAGITQVVINEFMASNETIVADQDGEFDDWIELFNGSSMPFDLSGYYLSDNPNNLTKWEIPDGTSIEPQGYLIFWADEDQEQEGLHTNFKLARAGEVIYLLDPTGAIVDEVVFGEQTTDLSSAREPNGTGDFVIKPATFALHNDLTSNTSEATTLLSLTVYPNPAYLSLQIDFTSTDNRPKLLEVYNVLGVRLHQEMIFTAHRLDISQWSRGVYFLRMEGRVVRLNVE